MRNLKFFPCLFFAVLFLGSFSVRANIGKTSEEVVPIYGPHQDVFVPFLAEKEQLTAVFVPTITQQPVSKTVCNGNVATFEVKATGSGTLSYQWFANRGSWYALTPESEQRFFRNYNTSTLTVQNWTNNEGTVRLRVEVTDNSGSVTSNEVTLNATSGTPPSVSVQPTNKNVCVGGNTSFQVSSSGSVFQWQVSTNGGTSFSNLSNGGNYSNVTTNTLNINNAPLALNNYRYRVIVGTGCTTTSNAATLSVSADGPVISSQPVNRTVSMGASTTFQVATSTTGATFQWQRNVSGTWTNVTGTNFTGSTTNTLTVNNAQLSQNGSRFRVVLKNSAGCSTTSNEATLTVNPPTACAYNTSSTSVLSQPQIPCIDMPLRSNLVSSNMAVGQHFVMNVIKGLTYQVATGNTTAPSNQLALTVFKNDAPTEPAIAFSYQNTGNPVTNANNVLVSFTPEFSGQVRVFLNVAGNCTATTPTNIIVNSNVSGGSNIYDDPLTKGTDNWIGHIYDGASFSNYLGYYSEPLETIDQYFGGDFNCFPVYSDGEIRARIYTETFSVRYRMNSSKDGLYTVNLGSDDGGRLYVDNSLVYDNFVDQDYPTSYKTGILLSLNNSELTYEYYEGPDNNRVTFSEPQLVFSNELTTNQDQTVCMGGAANTISGNIIGALPSGINIQGSGYQWTYSLSPDGERTSVGGATQATYTPDLSTAPFNNPGTYYFYRNSILSSTNNFGATPSPYIATHESNAAIITVSSPTVTVTTENNSICIGENTQLTANFSGTGPWTISANFGPAGMFVVEQNPYTIAVTPAETTTYTISSVTDANGCTSNTASSVTVSVNTDNTWTGNTSTNWNTPSNWSCNSLPTLASNIVIPSGLENYPLLSPGNDGLSNNITVETGASIEVNANQLQVAGAITSSGSLDVENGSMAFVGSTAQVIPLGAFTNNRIQNLTINNSAGVSSEAIIELTGILKVENGNFKTGNQLTLISIETQTALIDGSGNGEVTGLVHIQRFMDVAFGYKYFSSPVQPSTVGDFLPYIDLEAAFPNFYRYDENREITTPIADTLSTHASGWEAYTTSTSALNVMEGYAINFGDTGDPVTVELTGEVNNGNFSRTLSNNHKVFTKGFHLIGNPYPSPIDWDATNGWTKTNIDDGIYFFTAGSSNRYTGTYTSYVDGIASDGRSSNIIPSMQGFFIKVSDSETGADLVNGTLGMTNSVRINNFDQPFLKTREPELKPLLRLSAKFGNTETADAMVIYFSSQSSTDFEKEKDAHKMMNTDVSVPNLYSISTDKKQLSISGLPFPATREYTKIPLGIRAEKSGNMTISLQDIQNLPLNFNVYLIDKEKKIGQNLMEKESYSFNIQKGENNSRFHLIFSEEKITSTAVAFDELFSVQTDRNNFKVTLNLEEGQKGVLRASTVTGQILQVKEGRGKETVEFGAITAPGVYFINLFVGDQRFSKKVLIKN
ncbi:hypothetical protein RM545_15900 [Zunongwangia sp. F260]|uniref:Uncharacterized protein n=1 Tax=Autumnicola lenta TaxID=3075593 RepID=A0ABU3CPK5_9FLAO|nr:hypothetical protein [Zunongwangia sp. F260]MDT0648177.1 hypothetical protein [Zunongwangia sp. F260]